MFAEPTRSRVAPSPNQTTASDSPASMFGCEGPYDPQTIERFCPAGDLSDDCTDSRGKARSPPCVAPSVQRVFLQTDQKAVLAMIFKLDDAAEEGWRSISMLKTNCRKSSSV